MAATRRGCVVPTLPLEVYPASARYCGTWVVFPLPVQRLERSQLRYKAFLHTWNPTLPLGPPPPPLPLSTPFIDSLLLYSQPSNLKNFNMAANCDSTSEVTHLSPR